ncbi:MAG: hypothetical protein H0T82_08620, partial [Sphingomonas sp.]|nr:hypothetical protein [Sphingomonas sp.]
GYTVRGVQKLLGVKAGVAGAEQAPESVRQPALAQPAGVNVERLLEIRDRLASALDL